MPIKTVSKSKQPAGKESRRTAKPANALMLLRALIEGGDYAAGMVLPTERILAEMLGVGRPAIREAIKALTILDVLESRRGDGTYLKSLDRLRTDWPVQVLLGSKDFSLLDLLEVRKIFEPKAARLAASRATETHLKRIEEQCVKVEKAKDWKEIALHDLLLHTAIIEAAGNPVLTELNGAMTRLLRRSRELSGSRAPDSRKMNAAHIKIVEAILKGDGEEAEEAMLEHLHRVGLDLISDRKR